MQGSKNQTRLNFLQSDEAREIKRQLLLMVNDTAYATSSSYTVDTTNYPNNLIPFADKHIKYLSENREINVDKYLSNLRLITRTRI